MQPVWENELGGLTFEVGTASSRCFVKWMPGDDDTLHAEAERMRWAAPFTLVPEVIGEGRAAAGSWVATTPLPGESAVSERWSAEPAVAVAAVGAGLRSLHDSAPVDTCPFSWSVSDRVARAQGLGLLDTEAAGELLADAPPVDRLVVCHGDACVPNTIVDDTGSWYGHVDLGALGAADRWADLAVATWSTDWNYGPGWEDGLLAAYGVDPDPDRTAYYRRLWDLTS